MIFWITTNFIKGINYKITVSNKARIFVLFYDIDHVAHQWFISIKFIKFIDLSRIIYVNCCYNYLPTSEHKTEHVFEHDFIFLNI